MSDDDRARNADRNIKIKPKLASAAVRRAAEAKNAALNRVRQSRGLSTSTKSRGTTFENIPPPQPPSTLNENENMADVDFGFTPTEVDPTAASTAFGGEVPTAEEISSFSATPAATRSRGRPAASTYQPPIGGFDIPVFTSKRGRKAKAGKAEGVSASKYSAKRVKPEVVKIVFNQNTGMMEMQPPKGELNQKNALFIEWRKTLRKSPWFSDQPKHMQYIYNNSKIRTDGSVRAEFRRSRKAIMNHESYLNARPALKKAIMKKRADYAKYKDLTAEQIRDMPDAPALFVKGKRSTTGNKLRHNYKAQLVKATMKARSDAALKKKLDRAYYMKTGGKGKDFPKIPKAQVTNATGSKWATRYPPNIQATYFRNL